MWTVNARYLNSDNFVTKREFKNLIYPTQADIYILRNKQSLPEGEPGEYRVLNLAAGLDGILSDSRTSYFHNSLGGYSGAKMRRYQELFDNVFYDELRQMLSRLRNNMTPEELKAAFSGQAVLNMLNTRYIIYRYDSIPLVNNAALGNAWFVIDYYPAKNADEEIMALRKIDPANEAVIDQRFGPLLAGLKLVRDTSASIYLTSYMPNKLKYRSSAQNEQLAVFSEIYYDKGWNAYVDGKLTSHFRADYVLRAMRIPSGDHQIEFRFEPESYYKGEKVSLASSLLIIILVVGVFISEVTKRTK
jgi:hypothetical protein